MTDFTQMFQTGNIQHPENVLGSMAYVGGGYLPSNVTANLAATSSLSSMFGSTLSFTGTGTTQLPISTIQTTVSKISGTSNDAQQDVLLGITASTTLVGSELGIRLEIVDPCGKKNQPNPSW